jgi:hypothetical protein
LLLFSAEVYFILGCDAASLNKKKRSLSAHEDGGNVDGLHLLVLPMAMKESDLNSRFF